MGIALCLCLCACSSVTYEDPSEWEPTILNCWVCAIYGTSFEISNDIVFSATAVMFPIARVMLGIGLLYILLFRVGAITMLMPENKMAGLMKDTGFIFLKAIFVAVLLANGDAFLLAIRDYVVYPLGNFFMMMANAVLDCVPGSGKYFSSIAKITPEGVGDPPNVIKGVVVSIGGEVVPIDPDRTIFGDLGIQVQYTVSRIFVSLKSGAFLVMQLLARKGIMAWILGLIAGWQMFSLMVIFPLAFVDGFIMLAFYIIFLPFTITLWVFPGTKGYFKSIIPNILSPLFQLLFGCIIVVLMVTLIQVYADMGLDGILRDSVGDANSNVIDQAENAKPPIIIMVMLLIGIRKMASEVGDFAQLFTGTKTDATLFGLIDAVKNAAKKVAVAVAEVAAATATGGASAAASVARRAAIEAAKKAAEEAARGSGGGP